MNKDNAKDYLPLVQALAEGKTIQFNDTVNVSDWKDIPDPHFTNKPEYYRIKPEPRVIWVNEYGDGAIQWAAHDTKASAIENLSPYIQARRIAVRYVEMPE